MWTAPERVEPVVDERGRRDVAGVALRAAPGDRVLSDGEWGQVAREVMGRVGLAPRGDHGACRAVEERYGLTRTGARDRTAAQRPTRAETEQAARVGDREPPRPLPTCSSSSPGRGGGPLSTAADRYHRASQEPWARPAPPTTAGVAIRRHGPRPGGAGGDRPAVPAAAA